MGVVFFIFLIAILVAMAVQANSKEKAAEAERLANIQRKYTDPQVRGMIESKRIWTGMTREQLLDSWGKPTRMSERILKTKIKETYRYGSNRVPAPACTWTTASSPVGKRRNRVSITPPESMKPIECRLLPYIFRTCFSDKCDLALYAKHLRSGLRGHYQTCLSRKSQLRQPLRTHGCDRILCCSHKIAAVLLVNLQGRVADERG